MSDADDMRKLYESDPLAVNRLVVEQYRANDGVVEQFGGGGRMLLLTTTGARSGSEHTAPMMYLRDGERLVVYAANSGSPRHPAWYHNLVAHPDVTVEVGRDRFDATAVVTAGAERERLWKLFPFPQFQDQAHREIPVIALEPRT